jgi:hypothetical protein
MPVTVIVCNILLIIVYVVNRFIYFFKRFVSHAIARDGVAQYDFPQCDRMTSRDPHKKKAALPSAAFNPNRRTLYENLSTATHHHMAKGEQTTEQGERARLGDDCEDV